MYTEDAGLEVLSGCLALLALLFTASGGALGRFLWVKRLGPSHDQLVRLIIGFVTREDRSLNRVTQIEALVNIAFASDSRYEELATAVASFIPGGTKPFLDEAGLVKVFSTFLKKHDIIVPEEILDQSGVWPPPPSR